MSAPELIDTLATLSATPAHIPPIFLVIEPVDMRLGLEGLSNCVQTRLSVSPCAGGIYLFSNARRNRIKLLLWDGTGVWLARLADARRQLLRAGTDTVQLCAWRFQRPPDAVAEDSGIIVSYHRADALSYSVRYTQFLAAFLRAQGLAVTAPDVIGRLNACKSQCDASSRSRIGPLAVKYDVGTSTAYVCD